jgi:small subunit ribosomal protein S3
MEVNHKMEEKKFVNFKKEELAVKDYVKRVLGKGRISDVTIEYTPVGEKIIVATSKPGMVIGRRGEKIEELTTTLKKMFKLDNPHIDIKEITSPMLDAQLVADDIALMLEREGSLKFKVIAYRTLQNIMSAGALGAEIVLSGRLPSERAKRWRFAQGYLKKTGDTAKVVLRAKAQAINIQGVSGIQISILPPNAVIHDRVVIDESVRLKIIQNSIVPEIKAEEEKPAKKKTKTVRKAKAKEVGK